MNNEEAAEAISSGCPNWKVVSIRYLGEGDFCWAYVINESWVCRLGKHAAARQSLWREYCLLPHLADQLTLKIPSPQIMGTDEKTALQFTAYPLLPGTALSPERYFRLNASSRTRCAEQVATFLTELHAVDLSSAHACYIPVQNYAKQYADLLLQARSVLYPALDKSTQHFVEQTFAHYSKSGSTQAFHPVLLHGDLSPDHVLFDQASQSVTAIIDFGDMMIGDPAWDLVFIYEDYGLDFLWRVLNGYRAQERVSLMRRIYQHYLITEIDWAVGSQARSNEEFMDAIARLHIISTEEKQRRQALFSTCANE